MRSLSWSSFSQANLAPMAFDDGLPTNSPCVHVPWLSTPLYCANGPAAQHTPFSSMHYSGRLGDAPRSANVVMDDTFHLFNADGPRPWMRPFVPCRCPRHYLALELLAGAHLRIDVVPREPRRPRPRSDGSPRPLLAREVPSSMSELLRHPIVLRPPPLVPRLPSFVAHLV